MIPLNDYIWLCLHAYYLGHIEVRFTRKQTDEKRQCVRNHNNDYTFPLMRWTWICCFRRWHTWEHPHWLWILWTILVDRPWQCFYCNPYGGSISGSTLSFVYKLQSLSVYKCLYWKIPFLTEVSIYAYSYFICAW